MATTVNNLIAPQSLTYTSLLSDVQAYAERSDAAFVQQIPRFIELAEKQIAAEFKTLWEIRVTSTNLPIGATYIQKPARTRKIVSLAINGNPLFERTQEYIALVASEVPASRPLYWCEYAYKFIGIAPLSNIVYPVTIIYYEQVQPLSSENQTNLITSEAPQLLLFACMVQSATFLKDQGALSYWQAMYTQASAALKAEDGQRIVDRNTTFQTQQP